MTFILPSFGASAISAVPGGGGGALPSIANGYALSFDGTDDYVEVTGLGLSGATSFSVWFNSQSSGNRPLIHADSSSSASIYIAYISSGLYVYLYDSTQGGYLAKSHSFTASIGDWHNIVVTVDATSNLSALKLYVDGSEVSAGNASKTGSYTTFNSPSSNPIILGARNSSLTTSFGAQLIDEVAIFGSELSASQVASLRDTSGSNPVPVDISSLNPVGWWRMGDTGSDYGTSTITNAATGSNSGGSAINATIVNATGGTNISGAEFHDLSTAPDSIYVA